MVQIWTQWGSKEQPCSEESSARAQEHGEEDPQVTRLQAENKATLAQVGETWLGSVKTWYTCNLIVETSISGDKQQVSDTWVCDLFNLILGNGTGRQDRRNHILLQNVSKDKTLDCIAELPPAWRLEKTCCRLFFSFTFPLFLARGRKSENFCVAAW